MDLPNEGMLGADELEESEALSFLCEEIMTLMGEMANGNDKEAAQQAFNELDTLINSYKSCESPLLVTAVLRYSSQMKEWFDNWQQLLDIAVARWPEEVEKGLFVGLIKNDTKVTTTRRWR